MWLKGQMSILYIYLQKESLLCCCFLQVWDWSHTWETEKAGERPEYQRAGAEGARAASKDVGAEAHRTVQQPSESLLVPLHLDPPFSQYRQELAAPAPRLTFTPPFIGVSWNPVRRMDLFWIGCKKCGMGSERRDEKSIRALRVNACHW